MEAFYETIWARLTESQKLPRDRGESIFAARHQRCLAGPSGVTLSFFRFPISLAFFACFSFSKDQGFYGVPRREKPVLLVGGSGLLAETPTLIIF